MTAFPRKISLHEIEPFGVLKALYMFEIRNIEYANKVEFRLFSDRYESKESVISKLLNELDKRNLFIDSIFVDLVVVIESDEPIVIGNIRTLPNASAEQWYIVNVCSQPEGNNEDLPF